MKNFQSLASDLFYKRRIVVPSTLRSDILTKLHEGHMGVQKTKAMARQILF